MGDAEEKDWFIFYFLFFGLVFGLPRWHKVDGSRDYGSKITIVSIISGYKSLNIQINYKTNAIVFC